MFICTLRISLDGHWCLPAQTAGRLFIRGYSGLSKHNLNPNACNESVHVLHGHCGSIDKEPEVIPRSWHKCTSHQLSLMSLEISWDVFWMDSIWFNAQSSWMPNSASKLWNGHWHSSGRLPASCNVILSLNKSMYEHSMRPVTQVKFQLSVSGNIKNVRPFLFPILPILPILLSMHNWGQENVQGLDFQLNGNNAHGTFFVLPSLLVFGGIWPFPMMKTAANLHLVEVSTHPLIVIQTYYHNISILYDIKQR